MKRKNNNIISPELLVLKNRQEKLNVEISIPSEVHGYSLAIEYMKDWFLSKFKTCGDDGGQFFKTVYINGKHVLDDFRIFNNNYGDKTPFIKRPKPSVIITPQINFYNDRLGLKQFANMMGPDNLINRINYNNFFFDDPANNTRIVLQMQSLEVMFNFNIRVDTRAKQIDLFRQMQLVFRNKDTQHEYIDLDFHIPNTVIEYLCRNNNIEVDEKGNVVDPISFVNYLNMHSKLPITYKLRTINGREEYFIRVYNMYVHIDNTDEMSIDDGERVGMLDNNFGIEMNTKLTIPIPYLYAYLSTYTSDTPVYPVVNMADLGLYSFKFVDLPETNDKGWQKAIYSEYCLDKPLEVGEEEKIDFSKLLNKDMMDIIEYTTSQYLSPSIYIDIELFNMYEKINYKIDWDTLTAKLYGPCKNNVIIQIYVDNTYINEQMVSKDKLQQSRLKKS